MSNNLIVKIYENADDIGMKVKIDIKRNNSKPWFHIDCLKCKKVQKIC